MTKGESMKTGTERSRRMRARRAAGRMIVQMDLSAADIEMAQRLSGKSKPLTPEIVSEQMILALRLVASTVQKNQSTDRPPAQRGRGTWDDPFISTRKPPVWS